MEKVPELHGRALSWGIIACLALFAALVHASLKLPTNAFLPAYINGDAYDYHQAALNLYRQAFQPHPTRMFGFPLLTGWIVLWDPSFHAYACCCYMFNALCWLASIWVLLRIGGQLFGARNRVSCLPALLFGLNVGNIILISQAVTETFYVLLMLLAFWCWLRYRQNGLPGWLLAAFAVFCYSTVVRPTGTPWLLIILPAILLPIRRDRLVWRKVAAGMALSLMLTLGLQLGLMKARYDLWITSNIGLLTYYLYLDAYAAAETSGASWAQRAEHWERERDQRKAQLGLGQESWLDIVRLSDWKSARQRMHEQGAQTWSAQRPALLQSYTRNLVSNSLGSCMIAEFLAERSEDTGVAGSARLLGWGSRLQNAFYSLLIALFAGLGGYRFIFLRRRPEWFDYLAWFGGSIMLFSAISFAQGDRFHLVFMPFAALLLARQGSAWIDRKEQI